MADLDTDPTSIQSGAGTYVVQNLGQEPLVYAKGGTAPAADSDGIVLGHRERETVTLDSTDTDLYAWVRRGTGKAVVV